MIDGLYDGEINVGELATEEQLAGNYAALYEAYNAAAPAPAEAPAGDIVPGTYGDLVIADDMTFTMEQAGENMDGAAFTLLVTGYVENGVIDGLYDGEINVGELATEEQLAGNYAALYEAYNG